MVYQTREEMLAVLGRNLREVRLSLNISQSTLAERAGISLNAVRNLEEGRNSSTLSLLSVCRILKKTDWLMSLAPPLVDESMFERKDPLKKRLRAMPPRKAVQRG